MKKIHTETDNLFSIYATCATYIVMEGNRLSYDMILKALEYLNVYAHIPTLCITIESHLPNERAPMDPCDCCYALPYLNYLRGNRNLCKYHLTEPAQNVPEIWSGKRV